MTDGMMRW